MHTGLPPRAEAPALAWVLLLLAACGEDAPLSSKTTLAGDCAKGQYPRLVMCPNEVARARSRLSTPPYQALYALARAEAQKTPVQVGTTYDQTVEEQNGKIGKHAGLVALMENDRAMASRAVAAVSRMQSTWTFGLGLGSTDLFIRIVGPLQDALEGFDLVMGSGLVSPAERLAMETALGNVAKKLYEMWVVGLGRMLIIFCQNNYNTKLSTTLGLAALMLDRHPDRETWLRFAATEANRFYGDDIVDKNLYLSPEGVCKEPPAYFNFGARAAMPFAILYEYLVGKGVAFENDCSISTSACTERSLTLDGILHSPRFARAYDWMVRVQMPDGQRPSIDEGCTAGSPVGGALWQYVDGRTLQVWDLLAVSPTENLSNPAWIGYYLGRVDLTAVPPAIGMGQAQRWEASGQVVFRSAWNRDAISAVVLGESGLMRSQVHNHADATSFQLYAFGEMLALDTGYFEPLGEDSYTSRVKTAGPEAHNLILVDGKGAEAPGLTSSGDVDATIRGAFDEDGLDFAEVLATYQGVSFARSVLFARERYLVIADHLDADAAHAYAWRLHGHGGGYSIRKNYEVGEFSLGTGFADWTRSRAKLRLVLDSTQGPPVLTSGTFPHEWKSSWEGYHTHVDGTVSGTAARPDLAFLAVLVPQRTNQAFPAITIKDASEKGAPDEVACITVVGQSERDLMAAQSSGVRRELSVEGFSKVTTDARFIWIATGADGSVEKAFMKEGTELVYGTKTLIKSTVRTSAVHDATP